MNTTSFSIKNRTHHIAKMSAFPLDVLVIGGGIVGAGIALDASVRGMKTGLVEMNDFASGTSSRSTKLLEKEFGEERAILHKNAAHLIIPEKALLPVYKKGALGNWIGSFGLKWNDRISEVEDEEGHEVHRKKKTLELEPLLKEENLVGSGMYYDYRTDDARLTIEVLKTAHSHGASIVNYAKATELIYEDGKVVGAKVEDRLNGGTYSIRAKKVINAAGPWVDEVRKLDGSLDGKKLQLTKGVHLVFERSKLPVKQAVYMDAPDGRMICVVPRADKTYVGTTDTNYTGDISSPRATVAERDYLLNAINETFNTVNLTPEDVESNWAGIRPVIDKDGKEEIFVSPSGLITIAGGKLTGYRLMAEKVVDLVADQLFEQHQMTFGDSTTDQVVLSGGTHEGFDSFEDMKRLMIFQGIQMGFDDAFVDYLVNTYGSNAGIIFVIAAGMDNGELSLNERVLRAELVYCMEAEMTLNYLDFLTQRTSSLYFNLPRVKRTMSRLAYLMGSLLEWPAEKLAEHWEKVEKAVREAETFEK